MGVPPMFWVARASRPWMTCVERLGRRALPGVRRECGRLAAGLGGRVGRLAATVFAALLIAGSAAGAERLRVQLIAPDRAGADELHPLRAALGAAYGFEIDAPPAAATGKTGAALAGLRAADAVIVHRGPGRLAADDLVRLREFLGKGGAVVILGAAPEDWPDWPAFEQELLGATRGEVFAGGAPMTIINLFPHPIFTGVTVFETDQPVPLYAKLADDAEMIMEGTVGEATAPLAWVRRRPGGRMCHLAQAHPSLFAHPAFQRMVANALLWAAARPIPGARPAVQRTFMPDAHPGAFAITLPEGPGVCLDPVRGGINYIWDGDFVDLRPRWLTKVGEPARIFGEVFYRESEWQPMRAGAPGSEPAYQFRGYSVHDGQPEFHYETGGRKVWESYGALPGGAGLIRRFRVGPGAPLWIKLEPQPGADVRVRGLEHDGHLASFPSRDAGEFTIEIRRKTGVVR
jgi:hypothetical protein